MTVELLGQREGQRLEFKSREALERSPGTVARAVVGMLNAEGGEIWIGVEEEDGKAVAVEPASDPGRAAQRLMDYLLDALDPSPTGGEVRVEAYPVDADPALLRVEVRPAGDRGGGAPWAFRQKGGWHFLRRVGARNHPMSREELFGKRRAFGGQEIVDAAAQELVEARKKAGELLAEGLWLGLQPSKELQLDVQEERFLQIAQDPSVTGNRRTGWHFARSSHQPKLTKTGIEWGFRREDTGRQVLQAGVDESGAARFWVAIELLHWKGEEHEIWPLTLLEYPVSTFRIAREVYKGHLAPDEFVVADLALLGVGGWKLRAGTPGRFFTESRLEQVDEPDLFWEPVVFAFQEIAESPDRCGFRLVRRVYQAFGLREEAMPKVFDRDSGRLILPE